MAQSELKKKSKQVGKIKKKTWVKIFSPKNLGNVEIGETYVEDPKTCVGRFVQVNLMQITNDIKSQMFDVKFEIVNASENKLETKISGYYFSTSAIKRLVRRNMTRVDDSIVARTKDNYLVILKPLLLTRNKVTKSVEYSLRMNLRKEIISFINKNDYETVFSAVLKYQIQKELREKLNKIYPIKNLEIRFLENEKNTLAKETEMPKKKAEIKAKKKKDEFEEKEEKTDSVEEENKNEEIKKE
ncbi:MAG: hypothetical protein QXM96_02750 [Candidatus Woesearchaeota archaeon]